MRLLHLLRLYATPLTRYFVSKLCKLIRLSDKNTYFLHFIDLYYYFFIDISSDTNPALYKKICKMNDFSYVNKIKYSIRLRTRI